MGRLATEIAAAATNADNLPEQLPRVSLIDALLPRSITSPKLPLTQDPSVRNSARDSEVKKDKKGRLVIVRHKGALSQEAGNVKFAEGTKGDTSKAENGKKDKGGKKNVDQKQDAAGDAEKNEGDFTAEEDAKIIDLKALTGKEGRSWAQIGEEIGRQKHEVQARWKIINPNAGGNAGGGKGNDNKANENPNEGGAKKKGKGNQDGGGGGDQKGGDNQDQGGDQQAGGGKKGKKGGGPPAAKEWTPEDDAKLKELVGQHGSDSFKPMAKELKRPQADCQKRWEEIGGDVAAPAEEKKPDEATKQSKKDKKAAKQEAKTEEPKVEETKAPSVVSKARSTRSEAKFTMQEWMTLQEDDLFSFQELQLLCHILAKDKNQSWLMVASRFHDKTGRRVHPDDIREKFEFMATMG